MRYQVGERVCASSSWKVRSMKDRFVVRCRFSACGAHLLASRSHADSQDYPVGESDLSRQTV
jgi:hypothetical protein